MIPPLLALAFVLVALGAAMLGTRAAQRRFRWHPELSRKSIHVTMGVICLSFPWLFRESWPVWLLAGLAALGLGGIRVVPALHTRLGGVLGGVQRDSWGEVFFPTAVAFVFWLAHGQLLLFCVPVLILTLADACATIIGQRYGFSAYDTDDGRKSLEGSVAFFIVAFLSTHVALLLASNTGRLESLLIATVMGLILTLMEWIAWRGLDNLFIPLVSYVCLVRLSGLRPMDLAARLLVLGGLILGLTIWRRTTRLTPSAVIGSALVLYVTWAVGGWYWLIAPIGTALIYTLLCRDTAGAQRHTVHAIACVGGMGLCWLCHAQVLDTVNAIYAYGAGYAANLSMIAATRFADAAKARPLTRVLSGALLAGYVPLALPYWVVWHKNPHALILAAGALLIQLLALLTFAAWQPALREHPADPSRWMRQGILAGLASAGAFCLISMIEPWSKAFG